MLSCRPRCPPSLSLTMTDGVCSQLSTQERGCFHTAKCSAPPGAPGAGGPSLPCPWGAPLHPNHHSPTGWQECQRQPQPCQHHPRDAPDSRVLATGCTTARATLQSRGNGCPWLVPCQAGLSLTGHLHLGLALQQSSHPIADDAAVEAGVRAVQGRDHVPAGERRHLSGGGGTPQSPSQPLTEAAGPASPPVHCWAATPAPGASSLPEHQLLAACTCVYVRVHVGTYLHACAHRGDSTVSLAATEGLVATDMA